MWDLTDSVMTSEAIKNSAERELMEASAGHRADILKPKSTLCRQKGKEHEKDWKEHDLWKYLNGHSYSEYHV